MRLALEVGIPPEVLGVEIGNEEARIDTMEEGAGSQLHRIAKEGEVEVGTEVERHIAGIRTREGILSTHIEVERTSLCLTQHTTYGEIVLSPLVHPDEAHIVDIGQLVFAVVDAEVSLQSSLHIFIETFEQT